MYKLFWKNYRKNIWLNKVLFFSVNNIFNIKYNGKIIINLKNKIWKTLYSNSMAYCVNI